MTIASDISRVDSVGDGVNDTFAFTFEIYTKTDMLVYVGGVLKDVDVHYTVPIAGIENPDGGNIVFTVGNKPADEAIVSIILNLPLTQAIDYVEADKFPAETHERGLDRGVKLIQALKEESGRSLKFATSSLFKDVDIPDIESGKYLAGSAGGDGLVWGESFPTDYAVPWVDVRNYDSINAAVAAIGILETVLVIPNAQTLTADLTTPKTLSLHILKGGSIAVPITMALTINGPFTAGPYQVFSGTGTVTFGSGAVKEWYAEWWGIDETDDHIQIQAAIDSMPAGGGILKSLTKTYTGLGVTGVSGLIWEANGATFKLKDGVSQAEADARSCCLIYTTEGMKDIRIRDLTLDGNKANQTLIKTDIPGIYFFLGILWYGTTNCIAENVRFKDIISGGLYIEVGPSPTNCVESGGRHLVFDGCGKTGNLERAAIVIDHAHDVILEDIVTKDCVFGAIGGGNCYGGTINNIKSLSNNTDAYSDGDFKFSESYELTVSNLFSESAGGMGLYLYDVYDSTFSNSIIKGATDKGVYVSGSGAANCHDITFSNVHSIDGSDAGFQVAANAQYLVFNSCISSGNAVRGFLLDNDYNTINASIIENNTGEGVYLNSSLHNRITNNLIKGNSTEGVQEVGTADYNIIDGNEFSNTGTEIVRLGSNTRIGANNIGADETVTAAAPALQTWGYTYIDSASNDVAATLADGQYAGQVKTIVLTDATSAADGGTTVTVAHHEDGDAGAYTFKGVDDICVFLWKGTEWCTLHSDLTA